MIEKIPDQIPVQTGEWRGTTFDIIPKETFAMACRKINELVDAVNAIQKEREAERFEIQEWIGILEAVRKSVNIHEKQIDELQMKLEPEKCETPDEFAEQSKWIGKLCWFSQLYGCHQHIAILKRISESGLYVTDDGELHYAYCEPVKPDDDIIYKGEK